MAGEDYIHKNVLEQHASEIDKALSDVYLRSMKLNISLITPKSSAPTLDTRNATEVFDAFGRGNVELTD